MTQVKQKNIAVVTGASRGIGKSICLDLARNGYAVAALARNENDLSQLSAEIKHLGAPSLAISCDIRVKSQLESAFQQIVTCWGEPQYLVNNAGMGGPFHRTDEVSDAEWKEIFETNIDSVFHLTRMALPGMKNKKFGRIVNISSIQGLFGGAFSSTYAATKHALIGYTKSIATEWGAFGITCNAICPGYIATDMLSNASDEIKKELLARIPARRFGLPEEIAGLTTYLVGAQSGYLNGSVITIDGGLSAHLSNSVPG